MKKTKLFLLPFAGGNRHSYQFMIPQLTSHFEVIPVELPGRGKRMDEPLLTNFNDASLDYYTQITQKLDANNFMIYGHSLGALLGFHTAGMLQDSGTPPIYLFVSGSAGPENIERKNRHLLSHHAFLEELRSMGGMPQGVLENYELIQYFEPILRSDFELVESYPNEKFPARLEIPICALMGNKEKHVEQISSWKSTTKSAFDYKIFHGDHFFIRDHIQSIVSVIRDRSQCAAKKESIY